MDRELSIKRRPVFSAVAGLLLLSLIVGAALTTWKWREATVELAEKDQEVKSRSGLNKFFIVDLLGNANANAQPDPDIKLLTILKRASENVGKRFEDDPITEAEVRFQIGRVFYGLSSYDEALEHFQESWNIRKSMLGEENPETVQALFRVGKAEMMLDNHEAAIEIFDKVFEICKTNPQPGMANLYECLMMKAGSLAGLGRYDDAEVAAREFISMAYEDPYLDHKAGMERLAKILYDQGKFLECEQVIRDRMSLSSSSSRMLTARNLLASSQLARGDSEKAVESFAKLFEILNSEYGRKHDWTLLCAKNYADALAGTGEHEKAIEVLKEYLTLSKEVRGISNRHTVAMQKLLADVMLESATKPAD